MPKSMQKPSKRSSSSKSKMLKRVSSKLSKVMSIPEIRTMLKAGMMQSFMLASTSSADSKVVNFLVDRSRELQLQEL